MAIQSYEYNGKIYTFLSQAKYKPGPFEDHWIDCIIYLASDGKFYVRPKDEFESKFTEVDS